MFCECSAKTWENIDFIFNKLVNEMHQKFEEIEKKMKNLKELNQKKNKKKFVLIYLNIYHFNIYMIWNYSFIKNNIIK
jgi:ABC-type Fe3+-hydroxamate transport system substrate-binding protein